METDHRRPNQNTAMNTPYRATLACALFLGCASSSSYAQSPSPAGDDAARDSDVYILSPFEVSSEGVGRYQVNESTSGGRVRVGVLDTPGSVDVLTSDLIDDLGAQRMIEVAKYSAGLTEGNLPNSIDRYMIRGLQDNGSTVDGFFFIGQSNLDPAIIDRFEIVKGPNAILSPTGSPGGTVNAVTKKPHFGGLAASINTQWDIYGQRKAVVDVNDTLGDSGHFAYRVVASGQDSDSYLDNLFTKSLVVAPSITAVYGRSQLTIVGDIARSTSVAFVGLPIDPSSGTEGDAELLHGVSRTLGLAEEDEERNERRDGVTAIFTTSLGDHLSIRLAGRTVNYYFDTLQFNTGYPAGSGGGGSINPFTGYFEPGVTWTGNATSGFTSTPTPPDTRVVTRSGGLEKNENRRDNLQNDYVWVANFGSTRSTTTAGFAYSRLFQQRTNLPGSRGSYVIDDPVWGIEPTYASSVNLDRVTRNEDFQFYVQESLGLLDDRVVLTGGVSRYRQNASTYNALNGTEFSATQKATTANYGIVVKPLEFVSLYYGHSENAAPSTVTSTTVLPIAEGTQDEFGAKAQFLDGKVLFTVAHFSISQSNQAQPNPANLAVPPPSPPLPAILVDRENDGWEFTLNASVTEELSIIGQFTDMHNRDPRGVMVRSSADTSAAILVRYAFQEGTLDGFWVSLGCEYLSRRAGENSSGYTAASTPENLIPKQPSFFLAPYTLFNAGIGWEGEHWSAQVNVMNLTNEDYIISSLTRQWLWAGTERNVQLSVTYAY